MQSGDVATILTSWLLGMRISEPQLANAQLRSQRDRRLDEIGRAPMHEAAHGVIAHLEGLEDITLSLSEGGLLGRCHIAGDERAQAIAALAGPACDLLLGVRLADTRERLEYGSDFERARHCVQFRRDLGFEISERGLAAYAVLTVQANLPTIARCGHALRVSGELTHESIRVLCERAQ